MAGIDRHEEKLNDSAMDQDAVVEEFVTIKSIFVRHRNCLVLQGHFSPLFTDYYLNLMQHGHRNEEPFDSMFKDLLAYFTLYLVSRPWAEQYSWTVNLKTPEPANLFVTGSSLSESVVGRVFTEDVRVPDHNTLYSQLVREGREPRSSVVKIESDVPAGWVEDYYVQSEQRPARCFELPDECYTLVTAQPSADLDWLYDLTDEQVKTIEQDEETKILETRKFHFCCGCTLDKILPTLGTMKDQFDELFAGDHELEISCPRCGAVYKVTREMLNNL